MRSTLSMALAGFGVIFLGFGGTMLVIDLLGIMYGSRYSPGGARTLGLIFVVIGVVLYAGGHVTRKGGNRGETSG